LVGRRQSKTWEEAYGLAIYYLIVPKTFLVAKFPASGGQRSLRTEPTALSDFLLELGIFRFKFMLQNNLLKYNGKTGILLAI